MYFPQVFYFCQICPSVNSLCEFNQGALERTFFQINKYSFDSVKTTL